MGLLKRYEKCNLKYYKSKLVPSIQNQLLKCLTWSALGLAIAIRPDVGPTWHEPTCTDNDSLG